MDAVLNQFRRTIARLRNRSKPVIRLSTHYQTSVFAASTSIVLAIYSGCLAIVLAQCGLPCPAAEPQRISSTASAPIPVPTNRYIVVERAEIYSGPSTQYYPTSYSKRGESIEVYHRTSDGWLGIRPPQGSFSWLPATQGYLLPGGRTVEVTDETAVSWIGTELGTANQYRWQVQLHPGEQLTILGEAKMVGEDNREALWYRIAPPAGEFRWVRTEATADAPPAPIVEKTAVANTTAEQTQTAVGQEVQAHAEHNGSDRLLASGSDDGKVVQASYEEEVVPADRASTSRPRSKPATSRTSTGNRNAVQKDQWAGWHAMEFSSEGWTFPALDRLLGKSPATNGRHAPGTNAQENSYDPYDLAQQSSTSDGGSALRPIPNAPSPRPWRDPEALRQQRLANQFGNPRESGPNEEQLVIEPLTSNSSVELAVGSGALRSRDFTDVESASAQSLIPASGSRTSAEWSPRTGATDGSSSWYGISQTPQLAEYSPLGFSNFDLSQLHIALSEIVSQPMETWKLAPVAERVRYLVEHGPSAIERGEARLLLERIQSFQDLARRSEGLLGGNAQIASASDAANPLANGSFVQSAAWQGVSTSLPNASQPSAASTQLNRVLQPYDATGWLVPVHASSPNQPAFALTDESGKAIVYLSAAPGLNLDRYVNQAVGVFGLRGYLPQLKTNHIETQRIVRLR